MGDYAKEGFAPQIIEFKHKVDSNHSALTALFRRKKIGLFYAIFTDLEKDLEMGINVQSYVRAVYDTLLDGRRYLDVASVYTRLHDEKKGNKRLAAFFKAVVLENLNSLFIHALTYQSSELDMMFVDLLDGNRDYFFRLVSSVFKDYKLFNAQISDNMWMIFIDIADADLASFIMHADTHFLAFYLSNIPRLSFVPEKHISHLSTFLLSMSTAVKMIKKVLAAMVITPSIDILLIMSLMPRERERWRALMFLKKAIKEKQDDILMYTDDINYFVLQAMDSALYNFNAIPGQQKTLFADIILLLDSLSFLPRILTIVKDTKNRDDPKAFETRKIFASLFAHLFLAHKDDKKMKKDIVELLRGKHIDPEIKRIINKVIKEDGYSDL
ncbi:hypothetical protein KAH37_05980 [bacterium]|nr:hypothetical protein [bacterium]